MIPSENASSSPQSSLPPSSPQADVIRYFPLPLFASIMGITGLALVWLKAASVWSFSHLFGYFFAIIATILFFVISFFTLLRAIRYPHELVHEWRHPVRINFFAAITISLLLLGAAYRELFPALGQTFWTVGAIAHALIVPFILHTWITKTHYQLNHINPVWFIPVVGNVVAPIAGVSYGHIETSWYFFAVGITFWIVLLTIIVHRLIFIEPLPPRLTPTLLIFLAPPSVEFLAWTTLNNGAIDNVARLFYYVALFLAFVLALNIPHFWKTPFFLSAWAYSFPLAAFTIATLTMAKTTGGILHLLALILVPLTTAVIFWLIVKTIQAIRKRLIFLPEN
ncbi:MAG: SLAC1 anion channel family protein [Hydrogenophilus sp.]|nr:SLAC1 anion channel family protein [Hydrogenophilus sp.]